MAAQLILILGLTTLLLQFCLLASLFPSLFVVVIYVAVLAHASSIEFVVGAPPRLLDSAISMVTIGAHFLGIMRTILMTTVIDFLSIIK